MKSSTHRSKAAKLILALACCGVSTPALATSSNAIIIRDPSSETVDALESRLTAAGYTVTYGDGSTDVSTYNQVWDVRINTAISQTESDAYMTYLGDGGGLFLLGENAGFATRNNSIAAFVTAAGGGDIAYSATTVQTEYVTDIFNGNSLIVADSSTGFYVPAAGTVSSPGNGVFIATTGPAGTGDGTGIAFGAGSLTNALNGTLLTYFDVNTFQSGFATDGSALSALIDRMISFVAGDFQADPDLGGGDPTTIDTSKAGFTLADPAAQSDPITFDGGQLSMTGGAGGNNDINGGVILNSGGGFIDTAGGSSAINGDISGDGGLIVSGGGALALTGSNSFAGGTVVTGDTVLGIGSGGALGTGPLSLMGGTLQGQDDFSSGAGVQFFNGSNIIDTNGHDVTLSGALSGSGDFTKAGAGRLNLTGSGSYSGDITVSGGRLSVNGSFGSSNIIAGSGGTIGGNGLIGGLIVRNLATAAPGNSIGTITAATTVLFEQGSTYEVEVDAAGNSDLIVASGLATLEGGTVSVLAENGDYDPRTNYLILHADGGVDGTFEDVTSNLAFLMPSLSYGDQDVVLTLTRNDVEFANVAATSNQRATAIAINTAFAPTSDVYYEMVGMSADQARATFDSLSGEIHAAVLGGAAADADSLRRSLLDRVRTPSAGGLELWTQIIGNWTDLDGDGNAANVNHNTQGFLVGLEGEVAGLRLGVAGGYTDANTHVSARGSKGDVQGIHGAIYGAGTFGPARIRAGWSYTDLDIDTSRTAEAGAISQRLKASYGGRIIQAFGEAGHAFPLGAGMIEPFVGVNAMWVKNDSFTETGGSLALKGFTRKRDYSWSTLGLKADVPLSVGAPVSLHVKGAWQHALTERDMRSAVAFVAGGTGFAVDSVPLAKDAAMVDAGVNWNVGNGFMLGVGYSGTLANQSQNHAGKVNLSVRF